MSKTEIIMSEEEAMALPQSERPLCFRVPSSVYHDTFEAVAAAHVFCRPASAKFDSDEISKIAVELLFKIATELERLGVTTEMMRR